MENRILIKLSGEALMGESGYGIDVSTINFISKEIKKISIFSSDTMSKKSSIEKLKKIKVGLNGQKDKKAQKSNRLKG